MPGLVGFGRRWSVGSDDLVVPALILIVINSLWVVALVCGFPSITTAQTAELGFASEEDLDQPTSLRLLRLSLSGFVAVFLVSVILDGAMAYLSTRGTIINQTPRASIQYLVYLRTVTLVLDCALCVASVVWLGHFYQDYPALTATRMLIGVVVWKLISLFVKCAVVWCVYDVAGRRWVKVTRFQDRVDHSQHPAKGSGNNWPQRSWRQRNLELAYREAWNRRIRRVFCFPCKRSDADLRTGLTVFGCFSPEHSFSEVARLLSEFFSEADLVPTDLVAALVLLRQKQKQLMQQIVQESDNETYQFLSGVPISSETKFLDLRSEESLALLSKIRYYMQFALAAYGWPFYLTDNKDAKLHRLCANLTCCWRRDTVDIEAVEDNCCFCHLSALRLTLPSQIQLIYANFHCQVGETPFFLSVDLGRKQVVLTIRGTLSIMDLMTDFRANPREIPLGGQSPGADWLAHTGMVKAAVYVHKILKEKDLLRQAFHKLHEAHPDCPERLMFVGHSLGGGTATILGLMIRNLYPELECVVFSPPGGLLSWGAAEATREFVTTVVVGKDCVPRMGLPQMETLQDDCLALLTNSKDTKWKIISQSFPCCRFELPVEGEQRLLGTPEEQAGESEDGVIRNRTQLFPPGRILHVVRTWTKTERKKHDPKYTAIWVNPRTAFREVLISPVMIHDHMPAGVIDGLDKILERCRKMQGLPLEALGFPELPPSTVVDSQSLSPPPSGSGLNLTLMAPMSASCPTVVSDSQPSIKNGTQNGSVPTPKQQTQASVHFSIGLSSSENVGQLYRQQSDSGVETVWSEFLKKEVPTIRVLEDFDESDSESETDSGDPPVPGMARKVTYAGGHLALGDKGLVESSEVQQDPKEEPMGKTKSETCLESATDGDGSPTALKRTHEKEDVRYSSFDDCPGRLQRGKDMEDISGAKSKDSVLVSISSKFEQETV